MYLIIPASLFARYFQFFNIETTAPMQTWDKGTRRIYKEISKEFRDKLYLGRPVRKVFWRGSSVTIEDENGETELYDDVIFACNANQTLMIIDKPIFLNAGCLHQFDMKANCIAILLFIMMSQFCQITWRNQI